MTPGSRGLLRHLGMVVVCLLPLGAAAASPGPDTDTDARTARLRQLLTTPQGQEMLDLLASPDVRAQLAGPAPPAAFASPAQSWGQTLGSALALLRARLLSLGSTGARLGADLAQTWDWMRDSVSLRQVVAAVFYLPLFLLGGVGAERLLFRATADWRRNVSAAALDTMRARAAVTAMRLLYAVLMVVCFSAGSLGTFLLFRWPPPLGTVILDELIALVLTRLCLVALRFLLAPGAERVRLLPLTTPAAWFWYYGLGLATAVAAFGWQSVSVLQVLAVPDATLDSLRLLLGLALTCLGVALGWLAARLPHTESGSRLTRSTAPALLTLGLPLVWLAFVAGLDAVGWALLVLGALPAAIYTARHAAGSVVRGTDRSTPPGHGLALERAAQIAVLAVAALALVRLWRVDLWLLATTDTPGARLARGLGEAAVIVLIADLAWHIIRVRIDHRLAAGELAPDLVLSEEEALRQSRMRTILPLLRNALLILLLVLASLSALSAIGLRIGPLLAGAGIVGVALGLGAQTFVRDVISGVFFLLDDAFRVGEYIESGSIAGTVEMFSLRSIMLRHYKGQLHTVPFGDLKMVTNYSRSWMAAELEILVAHESELDAVEEALAEVSLALSAEPSLEGAILEPLQSLGVTAVTENAIHVGALVKTKAGRQFAARRHAYALIRQVFAARGIRFATPRLQIETLTPQDGFTLAGRSE